MEIIRKMKCPDCSADITLEIDLIDGEVIITKVKHAN